MYRCIKGNASCQLDNLERALAVDGNVEDLKKGVEMTIKGFLNSLEKLGVEEIDTTNGFDPNLHQAISVVEDENLNSNDVAQVYPKGIQKRRKSNQIFNGYSSKIVN